MFEWGNGTPDVPIEPTTTTGFSKTNYFLNKKNRGEYSEMVRIPKYLNKNGLFTAVFTTIAFSQKWINTPLIKHANISMKQNSI